MTTCIGIPLFGTEVSPRFCFADSMLVVEVEHGQETRRFVTSLGAPWLPGRVAELALLGIRTLLCGGFNRAYLPTAQRLGIQIITGLSGDAEKNPSRVPSWPNHSRPPSPATMPTHALPGAVGHPSRC